MRLKALAAMTAISLITASSVAAAATTAPPAAAAPSVVDRAGADIEESNALRGRTMWILAAIALGLIIWGIIELVDDDDEAPVSP